jgi:hypothetical protein
MHVNKFASGCWGGRAQTLYLSSPRPRLHPTAACLLWLDGCTMGCWPSDDVEEMEALCIPDEDEDEVPAPRVPEDEEEEVPPRTPEEDDVGGILAVKRPRASRFCVAAMWFLPPLRPCVVDPSVRPLPPPRPLAVDPSMRALPPPRPRAKDPSMRALPPRLPLAWVAPIRPLDPPPPLATDPSMPAISKSARSEALVDWGKWGDGGDGDA